MIWGDGELPAEDICGDVLQVLQGISDLVHGLFPPQVLLDQWHRIDLALQVVLLSHPIHTHTRERTHHHHHHHPAY